MKYFRLSYIVLLSCLLLYSEDVIVKELSVNDVSIIELSNISEDNLKDIEITVFGRSFTLELSKNVELFSTLVSNNGDDLFLRGTVSGISNSWVRLNRIDGDFSGGFFDGQELYLIDHSMGLTNNSLNDNTIVYRLSDLNIPFHIDDGGIENISVNDTEKDYKTFIGHLREFVKIQETAVLALPLTIVSDVEFNDIHGDNATSIIAGRINLIDGIYTNQLGVGLIFYHHEILSDNGPLISNDALQLLRTFRTFMDTGIGQDIPFEGIAHLVTGKNFDGSTIGTAFMDVLCSSFAGYGVNQDFSNDTTSALILAHEIGHNFSAPHDGQPNSACEDETFRGIMSASINGSQQFSDCSLDRMAQAVSSANCLVERGEVIFSDGFE